MNIGRTKSLALFLLVAISLVFTQQLWFYIPFGNVLAGEQVIKEIDPSITEWIFRPRSIMLHYSGNERLPLIGGSRAKEYYDRAYVEAMELLKQGLTSLNTRTSATIEDWNLLRSKRSIEINFVGSVPYDILLRFLNVDFGEGFSFNVDRVIISLAADRDIMFMDERAEQIYLIKTAYNQSPMIALMEDARSIKGINYYYLIDNLDLRGSLFTKIGVYHTLAISQSIEGKAINYNPFLPRDEIRGFSLMFFDNPSTTRTIEEASGAITISDYERGIRVEPNGKFEFMVFNVEAEKGFSRQIDSYDALIEGIRFLDTVGILREEIRFSNIVSEERQGKDYHLLTFDHFESGRRMHYSQGNSEILVELVGNKIKRVVGRIVDEHEKEDVSYNVLNPVFGIVEMSKDRLISENTHLGIFDAYALLSAIFDIELLYYATDGIFYPAYRIRIVNVDYYFNAISGEFLSMEERQIYELD